MTAGALAATLTAGVLTGAFSAVFGVGGGFLVIPFMVLVLGSGQHVAEGTSLAVIVPTAMVGAWAHSRRGYVRWRESGLIAAGGVLGAIAGALLAVQLDGLLLRRMYAVFLFFIAYRFLVSAGGRSS